MTYSEYMRKMATLVQDYEKLMAEIKKFAGEGYLYNKVYDDFDLVKFNLKFTGKHPEYNTNNEYTQKDFQEVYDKYFKILEDHKVTFERHKERTAEENFIENGVMTSWEFKQKLLEFKSILEKISYETHKFTHDIWHDKYSTIFSIMHDADDNIKEIDKIFSKDNFFVKENEKKFRTLYIEFKGVTTRCKTIWEEIKTKNQKENNY